MNMHMNAYQDVEIPRQPNCVYKVNGYSIAANPEDKKIVINIEPADSSHDLGVRIEMEKEEAMNLVSRMIDILFTLSKAEV